MTSPTAWCDGLFSSPEFDLDAYLARIGYHGPRAPTLEVLRDIHRRHPEAIPFENLDPLLARPVALDATALQHKLVRAGRGGYCFEHNLLLGYALHELGFAVRGLMARVRWSVPEETATAREHMLLLVELAEGSVIADVGFGALTLTAPLQLLAEVLQTTPHETFRLWPWAGALELQAHLRGNYHPMYRFDLSPQVRQDYDITSHFLSTHPASLFVGQLLAARVDGTTRYTLRNNNLSVHLRDGTVKRRTLNSVANLLATLREVFHITLPDDPALEPRLGTLIG